jgi:endonuclease/exonuclease/phosphatase family metal-dependent hydrolase
MLQSYILIKNIFSFPIYTHSIFVAASFQGIWVINIYTPLGAERKVEREHFFNTEVTYMLPTDSTEVLMAGDFNCATSQADCTGKPNMSRALETLKRGMGFRDVWEPRPHIPAYTHYSNVGASRIDRIYIADPLLRHKQGVATVAAAFSDHFAVILRMTLDGTRMLQKARMWRMNTTLLEESSFLEIINEQWGE